MRGDGNPAVGEMWEAEEAAGPLGVEMRWGRTAAVV